MFSSCITRSHVSCFEACQDRNGGGSRFRDNPSSGALCGTMLAPLPVLLAQTYPLLSLPYSGLHPASHRLPPAPTTSFSSSIQFSFYQLAARVAPFPPLSLVGALPLGERPFFARCRFLAIHPQSAAPDLLLTFSKLIQMEEARTSQHEKYMRHSEALEYVVVTVSGTVSRCRHLTYPSGLTWNSSRPFHLLLSVNSLIPPSMDAFPPKLFIF